MYDNQIKLKTAGPDSRFAKESISPALLLHARVVNSLRLVTVLEVLCVGVCGC